MEDKKATIKRTDVGQYEIEVETNKTYIISHTDGKLKIEETDGE